MAAVCGGATEVDTFKLLKLHGSLSWFWSAEHRQPTDTVWNLTPQSWRQSGDLAGQPNIADYFFAGLSRAIIPPLGTKDLLLTNLTIAEQWLQAGEIVADELIVIGYSLPDADRAARQLIAERFRHCQVEVVNPDDQVAERFKALGVREISSRFAGDPDCVEAYAMSMAV